ncbi:hypothetical protein BVER_04603 [Candidatus Burkholderia verschuerenii]|uniref:Uncharacterized protein n=1 Tax=Candidatus Burkholderia verschuerenii TaxID=242163 RepID=A0A0L0MCF1_9BURK|nr:hypothetical protein [Candidatus Burkholderia verschuerenii]KND59971.1 hypothetical protein BVER_04603 [Candidatus Burkholderia verschuerenii]
MRRASAVWPTVAGIQLGVTLESSYLFDGEIFYSFKSTDYEEKVHLLPSGNLVIAKKDMSAFSHHPLRLLNPAFDSPLVDVLTELEHLRRLEMSGTTPSAIFY